MAKNKNKGKSKREVVKYAGDKNIRKESISKFNEQGVLEFSKNVNIMRQTPDVNDGLKPVHRRTLYSLYESGDRPNKEMKKSAKIVGDIIGAWHPHGDASVYETITKLSQSWRITYPLFRFEGNYGNMLGDPAAHQRYTHCGLSMYAWKCFFEDFDIKAVPSRPNYLETKSEPEYLPSRYPNILLNSQFGIGVGASVNIPSYNFKEVVEAIKVLMRKPDAKLNLVPDLATGCDIVDDGEFESIFETGNGKFTMRAHIEVDEENSELTIYSLPLRVSLQTVKDTIIKLYDAKKIPEFVDFIDDTTIEDGVQLTIKLRKGSDVYAFRQLLFSKTSLQDTFSSYISSVDDYIEYDMSVRELLLYWIEARREYKVLYYNARYRRLQERIHINKLLLHIVTGKNGEKTLKAIRKAKTKEEERDYLMDEFGITSLQAKMLGELKMSKFSEAGIASIEVQIEDDEVEAELILPYTQADLKVLDKIILDELDEGVKLFGEDRRSNIISLDGEISIQKSNHVLVVTSKGKVKKLDENTESVGAIEQGDRPISILHVNNHDNLLVFDQYGKVHKLSVHQIISHDIRSHGQDINDYIKVSGEVVQIHKIPTEKDKTWDNSSFIFISKGGTIKRSGIDKFKDIRTELMGMVLKDGDLVQDIITVSGDKKILVYTENGMGGYFDSSEISETGRVSLGVKSIEMKEGDSIAGISKFNGDEKYVVVVTDNGKLKKFDLDVFPQIQRAGKPYQIVKTDSNKLKFAVPVVGDELLLITLTESLTTMDVESIPEMTRASTGKKVIPVKKGDAIIDVALAE